MAASRRETSLGIDVSAARSPLSQARCGLGSHPQLEAGRYRRRRRRSYSGSRRPRRGESPGGEAQQSHGEADGGGATREPAAASPECGKSGIQVSEARAPQGQAPSGEGRLSRLEGRNPHRSPHRSPRGNPHRSLAWPDRCRSSGARRQERDGRSATRHRGGEGQQSHGEVDGGGATRELAAANLEKGLRLQI